MSMYWWCADCNRLTSGDCGMHDQLTETLPDTNLSVLIRIEEVQKQLKQIAKSAFGVAAGEPKRRIEKAKQWIEDQTKDCYCRKTGYPFCMQHSCPSLDVIRDILDGKDVDHD